MTESVLGTCMWGKMWPVRTLESLHFLERLAHVNGIRTQLEELDVISGNDLRNPRPIYSAFESTPFFIV